jgi:hypothetical protein
VLFGAGAQPDRKAVRKQQVEGCRIGDQTARRGHHEVGLNLDHFLQRAALGAAVGVQAIQRMDLPDAAACQSLDLAVEFDERLPEPVGQQLAESCKCRR